MATTALRRLRGTVVLSVLWGGAWAVAGLAIGVTSLLLPTLPWHVLFDVFDAPLPALGVPGALVAAASAAATLALAQRCRDHASPRQSGDVRHLAASRPVASERSRSATSRPGTP